MTESVEATVEAIKKAARAQADSEYKAEQQQTYVDLLKEQSRLEQIQAIISERESKCMEYDDSIVRQMVECIKVYPGGKLEIIFGGGYLVEESV